MKCKFCGCTDAQACPGGCSWASERVCSRCADAQAAIEPAGPNAGLCRAHHRAAERIHATATWDAQVRAAAAAVSAERVALVMLIERAREIVYRGPFCVANRSGRRVLLGASLTEPGGYLELGPAPAQAVQA